MGAMPVVFMTLLMCGGGAACCGCGRGLGGALGAATLIFLAFWLIGGVRLDGP
jgi:hypothetical protein